MIFMRNFSLFVVLSVPVLAHGLSEYLTMKDIKNNPVYMATLALREAAKKGDVKEMKKCIQLGADVNDCEGRSWPHAGRMILTEAIDSGSAEAVEFLLKFGAIVEEIAEAPYELNLLEPKERNYSQLSYAIIVHASTEIINFLIYYSKDLNCSFWYFGWTPYKIAAFYKNDEAMELLKEAGANTDASIPAPKVLK